MKQKFEPVTGEQDMNERIVVGLDIGSTKVCDVVSSIDEQNQIHILGVGKAPSDGLNRGVVVNIDKTVNAIRSPVEQAELASGIEVNARSEERRVGKEGRDA